MIHLDPAQPELRTKLLRRYKKWLKLEQRNVVRFFGLTSSFGVFPALVTAWMSLGTLTQYLDNQYPFLSTLLKFSLVRVFVTAILRILMVVLPQVDDIISGLCYSSFPTFFQWQSLSLSNQSTPKISYTDI